MSQLKVNSIVDASGGSNAQLYGVASPPNSMGFRNRLINSGMVIDQRNAGASVTLTSSAQYTVDRWFATEDTDGTMTAQRSTVAPTGFTNSLLFTTGTADTSLSASQFAAVQQRIEGFNVADFGWGSAAAVTITLSFWVRSSLTGTFGGSLRNNAGDRSYAFSYSISAANTWEYKTVSIAGDTSGTWTTDNSNGIGLAFGLGVGSNFSGTAGSWTAANYLAPTGAVSVIGTAGATFYITGVQLEAGTVASPFERRDYGRELMMCQRYYYRISAANGSSTYTKYGIGFARSSTRYDMMLNTPVTMRAAPTSLDTSAANTFLVYDGGSDLSVSGLAFDQQNLNTIVLNITVSGATQYRSGNLQANNNTTSYLGLGAEL